MSSALGDSAASWIGKDMVHQAPPLLRVPFPRIHNVGRSTPKKKKKQRIRRLAQQRLAVRGSGWRRRRIRRYVSAWRNGMILKHIRKSKQQLCTLFFSASS